MFSRQTARRKSPYQVSSEARKEFDWRWSLLFGDMIAVRENILNKVWIMKQGENN